MKEIQPITKELLDSLTRWERRECISKYHKWIKGVRREDRRQNKKETMRIYNFKSHHNHKLTDRPIYISQEFNMHYSVYVNKKGEVIEHW